MYRFIAILSRPADNHAKARARALGSRLISSSDKWSIAFDRHDLSVLHRGYDDRRFHAYYLTNQGVVLGTLFHRSEDTDSSEGVIHARCIDELVSRYWGRYVGFLVDPAGSYFVFRDPTGALPCYFVVDEGITIFFSHLEDFRSIQSHRHTVDWRFVTAYLRFSRVVTSATGFNEVQQVLGGECIEISANDLRRRFFWTPISICEADPDENVERAAKSLADVTRHCVSAWISRYNSVLHQLSGGLDSAIVLSCLFEESTRPHIVCLNMCTEALEGDERLFARKAAERVGCELVEVSQNPYSKKLEHMLFAKDVPTPLLATFESEAEDFRECFVRDRGLEAIFTGHGGDHLFQRRRDNLVASEFLHRHGLRPQFLSAVIENAQMTGHSIWSVLMAGIRYGVLRQRFDPYRDILEQRTLLTESAMRSVANDYFVHPWLLGADRLPRAKLRQLFDLIDCQCFYAVPCAFADLVHPLISQPVMECTLGIPTYLLSLHGQDRGLARRAFASGLPEEIRGRTSKGSFTSFIHNMILGNIAFVREFLLDGALVREKILDRSQLEAALSIQVFPTGRYLQQVLAAVLTEAWLQQSAFLPPIRAVSA